MKSRLFLLFPALFVIVGCSSTSTKFFTFDQFQISIDSQFQQISPRSLQDGPLSQQILFAAKISSSSFSPNIIVTKQTVSSLLSSSVYSQVLMQKLQSSLPGYKQLTTTNFVFSCGDQSITAVENLFQFRGEGQNTTGSVIVAQVYFVHLNRGFVVSAATTNLDQAKVFMGNFEDIECPQTVTRL